MSYNPNYPGGYPANNYPYDRGQPAYPTTYPGQPAYPTIYPGQPTYPTTYPGQPAYTNPPVGYPVGTYPPPESRTDVTIRENRCGETITITERVAPPPPPVYPFNLPPAQTSTTVFVEERETGRRGVGGGGFATGVAVGMTAEAVIDSVTGHHHRRHHHHHHDRRHHW